jgi:hypothetical protein
LKNLETVLKECPSRKQPNKKYGNEHSSLIINKSADSDDLLHPDETCKFPTGTVGLSLRQNIPTKINTHNMIEYVKACT